MQYLSTRGGIAPISFCDTVLMGLATDGGLLLPASIPDVRAQLPAWRALAYPDLARALLGRFMDDLPPAELDGVIARGYAHFRDPAIAPVKRVGPLFIQELFHGPTLAFKDLALQPLGELFGVVLGRTGGHLNVLAATSGDTGSAAIHGVRGRDHLAIVVLHPHQRVSPVQERQMTTVLDANVHNLAIRGNFDDCQDLVKRLFNDLTFKERYALGAVNSVNLARVLIQVVYYFYGVFRVQEATGAARVHVCVPTGNFGNVFAGWLARRMGAPIGDLLLASNENNILDRFFRTGEYARGAVQPTLSPSMDIQVASNFERYLYYHFGADPRRLADAMRAFGKGGAIRVPTAGAGGVDSGIRSGTGDTAATLSAIRRYYEQHGYLLDPHTAVGVAVAEAQRDPAVPTLCLATAHPAKFGAAVAQALGRDVAHHPELDRLAGLPTRCTVLPNDLAALRGFLTATLA